MAGAGWAEECVGSQSALPEEGLAFSDDHPASSQSRFSAGAPEPTFPLPAVVALGEGAAAPEDPRTSTAGLADQEEDEGCGEAQRRRLHNHHYGAAASGRWAVGQRDGLEEEGESRRADPAAPKPYEEVEGGGGGEREVEDAAAPSA